jgi:hypothetical protein
MVLLAAKLWLTRGQSLMAIAPSVFDDRLYLTLASYLTRGQWLGPYNELTLIKMPFYSGWVALSFALSIPLLLSEHLLYAGASLAFALTVRRLLGSTFWAAAVFVVLLWNPASFADQMATRPMREGIYPALVLLVLATSLGTAARLDEPRRSRLWLRAALLGLTAACAWLTREEGIWLLPVAAAGLVAGVRRPLRPRRIGAALAITASVFLATLGIVMWKNYCHYGIAVLSEQTGGPFIEAYAALTRVRPVHARRFVPLPREVRERIYAVSPTFAKLRPALEGPAQAGWIDIGCGVYAVCDDVGVGAVHFDIRSAAAAVQEYRNGPEAARFWRDVAREVDLACDQRRLDCAPRRPVNAVLSGLPAGAGRLFLEALGDGTTKLSTFSGLTPIPTPSVGPIDDLDLFRDLTRERLSAVDAGVATVRVTGWVARTGGGPVDLHLELGSSRVKILRMGRLARPDVEAARPAWFLGRTEPRPGFEMVGYCPGECVLVVTENGTEIARTSIYSGGVQTPELALRIEEVRTDPSLLHQARLDRRRLAVLVWITKAYQWLVPPFLTVAAVAWLFAGILAIGRRRVSRAWLLATAALVVCLARLGLLAAVAAVAFPTMNSIYLSPAYPFLLAFLVLSFAAAAAEIHRLRSARRGERRTAELGY